MQINIAFLATDLILKKLLVEIAQDGTQHALLISECNNPDERLIQKIHYAKLDAISGILASILPGVSPAQVAAGFRKFAPGKNPYAGFNENDVLQLLETIRTVWKEG